MDCVYSVLYLKIHCQIQSPRLLFSPRNFIVLCFIFRSVFLFKKVYLIVLDYAGSLLLCGLFSNCVELGLLCSYGAWASHCGGFSYY